MTLFVCLFVLLCLFVCLFSFFFSGVGGGERDVIYCNFCCFILVVFTLFVIILGRFSLGRYVLPSCSSKCLEDGEGPRAPEFQMAIRQLSDIRNCRHFIETNACRTKRKLMTFNEKTYKITMNGVNGDVIS